MISWQVVLLQEQYQRLHIYGTDNAGVSGTTKEIVQYSVKQKGYNAATIASDINKAIDNSYLLGVNYIEPKDINIVESTRSVGIYFNHYLTIDHLLHGICRLVHQYWILLKYSNCYWINTNNFGIIPEHAI